MLFTNSRDNAWNVAIMNNLKGTHDFLKSQNAPPILCLREIEQIWILNSRKKKALEGQGAPLFITWKILSNKTNLIFSSYAL